MVIKAGEDLEEIEEEDEEALPQDEEGGLQRSLTRAEAALSSSIHFEPDLTKPHDETTPLIQSTISRAARGSRIRRKRASSIGGHGEASVTDAVLMVRLDLFSSRLADGISTVIESLRRDWCAVFG